jgi:hypothetical protein
MRGAIAVAFVMELDDWPAASAIGRRNFVFWGDFVWRRDWLWVWLADSL